MISSLRGKLIYKNGSEIILDVNGVGYAVFISKKVAETVTDTGAEYTLITHLDVKESSLILFGFADEKERELFKMLLSVSGIGPKIAHNILVHTTFEEVLNLIVGGAQGRLKIPGVGAKKMELITMTLRDKIFKITEELSSDSMTISSLPETERSRLDALKALMNLGYPRNEAEKIIREVLKASDGTELTTEEIIKKSLNHIS